MLLIFDRPHYGNTENRELQAFRQWMIGCMAYARDLCRDDNQLAEYIEDRKIDIALIAKDYDLLVKVAENNKLVLQDNFSYSMIRIFTDTQGLSQKAKRNLSNKYFTNLVEKSGKRGVFYSIDYVISRATSLDWSILDLFYQLNGFKHFRKMYNLAERNIDEGPICNLGLITQYLSRFMDEYATVITASWLTGSKFVHSLFSSFTYALYRLGESEYEDADDPFPKGRISFLTIHQSKGLEFPVVVLGSVEKREWEVDKKEIIVRDLLKKDGEPLDKIAKFDNMRMFYVALSRAKNLLILPRIATTKTNAPSQEQIRATDEFRKFFLSNNFTSIPQFDTGVLPKAHFEKDDLGTTYSYTSDYLNYVRCPRQYMIMRKYGFEASRSQTMLFGSLVHRTIEDLHYLLINQRKTGEAQ
jgi:DNA helicase-2/ATP-dependent DNA helicase PcrA